MGSLNLINQNYKILASHFGPQYWWPAGSRWEIMAGAVLTQNTSWPNVEKAIRNLKINNSLNFKNFIKLKLPELQALIRPAGFYRQKSRYLMNLALYVVKNYGGSLTKLFKENTLKLRRELLSIKGIGPETADSILLYAGGKLIFVVDAYTKRIAGRWGIMGSGTNKPGFCNRREDRDERGRYFFDEKSEGDAGTSCELFEEEKLRHRSSNPTSYYKFRVKDYHSLQSLFQKYLPRDVEVYNEYHALLVALAKNYCKSKNPLCLRCPLQPASKNLS